MAELIRGRGGAPPRDPLADTRHVFATAYRSAGRRAVAAAAANAAASGPARV